MTDETSEGAKLDALQDQVDRRIQTQQRELHDASEHLKDLIAAANAVDLREYVEAIMEKSERALEMAEREREKAAVALREQTQKALDKADSEREKAAQALRLEGQRALDKADVEREKAAQVLRHDLAGAIAQGDENLRNHINQEIERIREALASGEKLEISRVDAVVQRMTMLDQKMVMLDESARIQTGLIQGASADAIAKSEVSYDKRFEGVNELRAQMGDLIASHQKSLSDLTSTLMPREVADTQMRELSNRLHVLEGRVDRLLS